MRKQQPMLMWNPITQRVYIVTSYKDEGNGVFTARKKHDVTDQFDALMEQREVMNDSILDQATSDEVADTLADFCYIKVNGNSRWFDLFGTPERTAKTLVERLDVGVLDWCNYDCDNCPYEPDQYWCEQVLTLLEWLKGDA